MTTNRRQAEGSARRTFVLRSWARPPGLILLGLALVGLVQAGCRSDGCSTCGGFGSRFTTGFSNRVQSLTTRVTNHFNGCRGGSDCGCGSEGTVFDSGVPVIPGGMVTPGSGTIVPAPLIEPPPTQLEAIPNNQPTNPTSGTGLGGGSNPGTTRSSPSGANRSAYTTMSPKAGTAPRRGSEVARALHSAPGSSGRSGEAIVSPDLIDTINIPPVDLPSDVTRKAVTGSPGNAPAANPAMAPPAAPASDPSAPTPAEKVSAAEGAFDSLPPIIPSAAYQAPGIRRFASIAPSIGGGSAPSIEGLDWLKEKGYRTFIDLRRGNEIDPNFVDAVNDRNMVYISLPIVANRLDSSRLARFDDLISQSDNRPLFFCDNDGTRAGLVWYIHLRVVSQEDSQSAAGKAEEIGLTDVEIKLAEAFLATHKPRAKAATAKVASANVAEVKPQPAPAPPAPASPGSALPFSPTSTPPASPPAAAPPHSDEPSPLMLPGEDRPQASSTPQNFRDPAFLRPVAALVLTAIGVPLAYWSRSAFSIARTARQKARTSLPAAEPRSPEAQAGSDA